MMRVLMLQRLPTLRRLPSVAASAAAACLLVSCANTAKLPTSAESDQRPPAIGTVQSRNQFVICAGCDVAPTPKTLAVASVPLTIVAPATPPATPSATPKTTPQIAALTVNSNDSPLIKHSTEQVFESGVHPTDLVVHFERGSAVVPQSALGAIANLRPAVSVPHILHLVASTDGVGSRRVNRVLADARAQAVAALLSPSAQDKHTVGAATKLRKQLKITTAPAVSRGINPSVRTVLIQIEVL